MTRDASGPQSIDELVGRARVAVERWKTRLRDESLRRSSAAAPRTTSTDAARADIRAQMAALELELASIQQTLIDVRAQSQAAEQRAMTAIRAGDDYAAKHALTEQQAHVEAATRLEADVTVLDAIVAECRYALDSTVDK